MKSRSKKYVVISIFLLGTFNVMAQEPDFVTAKASDVSLYLNSAEISQKVNVLLREGTNLIVVKNVANQMDDNSIRVSANKPVTILSASFTNQYYNDQGGNQNSALLKKVKDSINWVNQTQTVVYNTQEADREAINLLDKNKLIGGANTGVSVAELSKMVDYYRQKRLSLKNEVSDLDKKTNELQQTLQRLQNQLTVSQGQEGKISNGKIVLQIMSEQSQTVQLDLFYITSLARWQPFYEIESKGIDQPLHLITKAKVMQTTGFDWKQVMLSFSSTQPNPDNSIPDFSRWLLRFRQPLYATAPGIQTTNGQGAPGSEPSVQIRGMGSISAAPPAPEIYKRPMTNTANALQDQSATSADFTQVTEQTLSVNYKVSLPYDIDGNGKTQTVTLADQEVPATYNYYAAPKLNKDAYLVAKITDYAKYNLLKGEANITFEGRYVGKTFLDPSSTKDTLQVALGVDKDIVVKREQVQEKSGNKTFSGYRQSEFAYKISVRNNKKTAVDLELKDQFPISTDKEITVDLGDTDGAEVNNENGTLIWKLTIKPEQTKAIQFGYKVKYPKDKVISNL